jgi:hypothetical protein
VVDAGLIGKPSADHALHDTQHRADGLRLAGEQEAQRVRKTQHPLPHRPRAKHLLHQVPRALGHAPRPAAGAEAALLAGKGHQPLGPALLAHHAQETVLEHAAAQVRVEFLTHVRGQAAVLRLKAGQEIRVVRLDQRVQQRALGRVARITRSGVDDQPWRAHRSLPPRCGEARHAALRCRDGCSGLRPRSALPIGIF